MTSLQTQIAQLAEFDRKRSIAYMRDEHTFLVSGSDMDAAELENARLKPLILCLSDCVSALEKRENLHQASCAIYDEEYYDVPNPCTCTNKEITQALARLREVLAGLV